jgi:hypothetical protein
MPAESVQENAYIGGESSTAAVSGAIVPALHIRNRFVLDCVQQGRRVLARSKEKVVGCTFAKATAVKAAAFLLVLPAGLVCSGSAVAVENADRPDVHVGDLWSWQHTNGLAGEKDYTTIEDVLEVSDSEIKTRERVKGKPNSSVAAFTREWNPADVVIARYDPFLRELSFPLQIGKKWDASADKMLFSNGKHGNFVLKGEVVALEKVTVPAGTFDAYKITLHIDATVSDEDANIGNTLETIWYAPAVKRYVKYENTFSRDGRVRSKDVNELIQYSLR